jgi:MFS family permease
MSTTTRVAKKTASRLGIAMCVLGALFYCYEYYLRVAPSVMGVELKETFGLSEAAFGHLAAFFYYAYTPLQIPVGVMMDRFGPRKILSFACFLCAIGTYLFAATTVLSISQIGRFLVGFGSAFAYVGVLKLSNVWLPRRYFAMMAGICTALGMFGAIGGEVLMTYSVAKVGWQITLYYSVIAGFLLTAILWFVLRDGKAEAVKVTPSLASTTAHQKFTSIKQMVFSKEMWISGIIGCLTFLPISAFAEIWAVSFLQATGMSKPQAAFGSSMVFLGFAVGGPLWGIISDTIQSRRVPLACGSFIAALLFGLAILFPSDSIVWMYSLLFFGAFFASVEIVIFAVSNDLSRGSVSATAVAFTNMIVMVGGALLPPLIGKMLDNATQLVDNMPVVTSGDYATALAVIPSALMIAGILSLLLKESYPKLTSKR